MFCSADSLPISLSLTFYYSVIFLNPFHSAFLQPHQGTLSPKQNRYQQALVNKDKPNGDAKDREVVYATLLLSLSSEITGGGAWRHCIHLLSDMSISSDDSTRQQAWHLAGFSLNTFNAAVTEQSLDRSLMRSAVKRHHVSYHKAGACCIMGIPGIFFQIIPCVQNKNRPIDE